LFCISNMLLLLFFVSAEAQLSCPATTGVYGSTCSNNAVSYSAASGCQPSSDCGFLYCCLACTTSSNTSANVCMLPPAIGQVTINCIPNTGPNSWFGCPCTNASQCPNGGVGWYCSNSSSSPAPPLFQGKINNIVGSSQSGYTQNVCWTNTLNYTSTSSPVDYYHQFSNGVLPVAPICQQPNDCKYTQLAPSNMLPFGPFFCDANGAGTCSAQASCDPVTHACQSRQVPAEVLGANTSVSFVNKGWWYNQWWAQTNCYNC